VTSSTGMGTAPTGTEMGFAVSFRVSGPHEHFAGLAYYFQPVGTTGEETEIRVDSQAVWEPSRSAAELAPAGGTVEVTGFSLLSTTKASSGPVTVRLSVARADKLRAAVNALPLGPPPSCMEDALLYRIVFRSTKGTPASLEADGWGCSAVVLVAEHGRSMAPLSDVTCSLLHAVLAVLPAGAAEGTRHASVGCRTRKRVLLALARTDSAHYEPFRSRSRALTRAQRLANNDQTAIANRCSPERWKLFAASHVIFMSLWLHAQ
jgi:hypothetical protein